MFFYYLRLAAKSLLATPGLTLLTLVALGLGIAVPTASLSIRHVFVQDPFPGQSDRLYNVRVDSWETGTDFFGPAGEPPKHITYQDMFRLRELTPELPTTAIGAATIFLFPPGRDQPGETQRPYQTTVRLCHADFFPMFDTPFAHGGPWSRANDVALEHVVVISHDANDKLFGGGDNVGKTIRLGDQEFEVVGILAPWKPSPKSYDLLGNAYGDVMDVFMPFDFFLDDALGLDRATQSDGFGARATGDTRREIYMASETHWIQYWIELGPDQVADYRAAVDQYALAQKEIGRFPRPLNNRVQPLLEWQDFNLQQGPGPATNALVIVSVLFLAVCCLNLTGLLLAKFLSRSGVLGVHRALGAPMRAIFFQRLVECLVVAVGGGALGALLAGGGLHLLDRAVPDRLFRPETFALDSFTLAVALLFALVAGVLSGLYPAWRACRVAPAMQLKVQ